MFCLRNINYMTEFGKNSSLIGSCFVEFRRSCTCGVVGGGFVDFGCGRVVFLLKFHLLMWRSDQI